MNYPQWLGDKVWELLAEARRIHNNSSGDDATTKTTKLHDEAAQAIQAPSSMYNNSQLIG